MKSFETTNPDCELKILRCCKRKPSSKILYDVGTFGERTFLVCDIHIIKKPWNQHIKSQIKVGDEK